MAKPTTQQQVNQSGTVANNISVDLETAKQLYQREGVLKLERLKEENPQYKEDSTNSELSEEQDGDPVPVESDSWELNPIEDGINKLK